MQISDTASCFVIFIVSVVLLSREYPPARHADHEKHHDKHIRGVLGLGAHFEIWKNPPLVRTLSPFYDT